MNELSGVDMLLPATAELVWGIVGLVAVLGLLVLGVVLVVRYLGGR